VNFNLIKYFIIDLKSLENTESEIIESIFNFNRLYINTRIIILAESYDSQNSILNSLYEKRIYNIINSKESTDIGKELIKCLSNEGIQKKEAKKFEKIEEVKINNSKIAKLKEKVKHTRVKKEHIKENNTNRIDDTMHQTKGVYFFALLFRSNYQISKANLL